MTNTATRTADLTQPMHGGMYVYDGDPEFERRTPADDSGAEEKTVGFQVSELSIGSHAGIHVDAPRHYYPDGATIEEFDAGRFRMDAVAVAVDTAADEPFAPDVDAVAPELGSVVVRTGRDEHWGEERYDTNPYRARDYQPTDGKRKQ